MALMMATETFHISCGGTPLTIQRGDIWDSAATVNAVVVTTAASALFTTMPNGTTGHKTAVEIRS